MTPADTPAPSALDALLREVETREARERHLWDVFDNNAFPFRQSDAARLAAIVRVLREALSANLDSSNVVPSKVSGWRMVSAEVLSMARTALARAEAIAKGE